VDLDDAASSSSPAWAGGFADAILASDKIAVPSPWLAKDRAARITCSSSPSAKTTRFGYLRTRSNTRARTPAVGSRRAWSSAP
jgi:hypothetical protein